MHTERIKWRELLERQREKEWEWERKRERYMIEKGWKKISLSLFAQADWVCRMYISTLFLRPGIFLTRANGNGERGVRCTRGMRSATNGDSHNPFILQNAIIVGWARAVQIAIVRITMPPPDDECYWITPPIQPPRYRTHRSVRGAGNTSNTINCRRYELGDDDKLATCSIKTSKRSIYRGKIHFSQHLGFAAWCA